jgi:hypothetical protein
MKILDNSGGDFYIKLHIRNKSNNIIWNLVSVYGTAQDTAKSAFLCELVNLAKDNPHPIIVGGDFNLLRYPQEKSRGSVRYTLTFDVVIDSFDLREVSMIERQFT